jgi:hypothetical protein
MTETTQPKPAVATCNHDKTFGEDCFDCDKAWETEMLELSRQHVKDHERNLEKIELEMAKKWAEDNLYSDKHADKTGKAFNGAFNVKG